MGFKSSMITVNNQPATRISDRVLLEHLGFGHYEPAGDTTLEECLLPMDESINIGYFNNHLIICDDYLLSDRLERLTGFAQLSDYERTLTSLFPQSEILTTSCHSVINLHLYTLVQAGERKRFKAVTSESPVMEYGEWLEEEKELYAQSKVIEGRRVFRDGGHVYAYTEDQLMENFTFGIAKRHLGVMISTQEDEELMLSTVFRKYRRGAEPPAEGVEAMPATANASPNVGKRSPAPVVPIGNYAQREGLWKRLLRRFFRPLSR